MKFVRTLSILTAVAATTMATSVWAASDTQHDSHHPATAPSTQVAQAAPATPGMGMGMSGMAEMPEYVTQMGSMQTMHDKMMAAKTPEERNALMTEQMKLMQAGMGLMGRMGPGAMAGKPGDMAARQGMMEQRMDMMQSMMQMMMDRMPPAPAMK
ncbi:hypothetical protein [Hydrogenophaga sp. PAMC20947]|uniref:hypothetical protein n=1 Tax=Hydrogenophaga sp. PAMC20947 TaxID=2565558 RepID=UPI00109D8B35|nr:hypothetical protein [Hydrogenophaga sp. PAMC20947]QCB46176.1 hypothetical protein E5678_09160 [Hydrogenophaga sp. PAMC20947]